MLYEWKSLEGAHSLARGELHCHFESTTYCTTMTRMFQISPGRNSDVSHPIQSGSQTTKASNEHNQDAGQSDRLSPILDPLRTLNSQLRRSLALLCEGIRQIATCALLFSLMDEHIAPRSTRMTIMQAPAGPVLCLRRRNSKESGRHKTRELPDSSRVFIASGLALESHSATTL